MKNIVEMKVRRKELKLERQPLVDILFTREHDDEEASKYDNITKLIESLSARIDALEKVENGDEERDEDAAPEKKKDEEEVRSRNVRHLDFSANIVTSKTKKDSHEYSVRRALMLRTDEKPITGLEGEWHQELVGKLTNPSHGGVHIPWDFKLRGKHRLKQRALDTSTGAGAVGIRLEPNTFIEYLRSIMVFEAAGGKIMENCKGKFSVSRQSGVSTMYFIAESGTATSSNATLDQVAFVPVTAAIQTAISRKFLYESSIQADTFVEEDLMGSYARGLDTMALVGNPSTTTNSPTGILYNSAVTNYTVAADIGSGGAFTYADAVAIETALNAANANRGTISLVTTPGVKGKLKATPKLGSTFPVFVWSDDEKVNGYPGYVTSEMLSLLTKGSGTALHSLIFGNFEDAILALWESGLEVLPNPYLLATSGAVQYNLYSEVDTKVRHGASFQVCTDINVS